MRRAAAGAALLALAACARAPAGDPEPPMVTIDCATGGATTFTRDCRVEPAREGAQHLLVVHHPGGGFRRLLKVDDGRGVVAADGVEEARVQWLADGRLEVSLGGDRYRFPATVKPDAAATPQP